MANDGTIAILNHRRQDKVLILEPGLLRVDHISERKAGGSGLAINAALFEWFILQSNPEDVSVLIEGKLSDLEGEPSSLDPDLTDQYADVTEKMIDELLEAERIAEPEDFAIDRNDNEAYDMGHARDFIPQLLQIWRRKTTEFSKKS